MDVIRIGTTPSFEIVPRTRLSEADTFTVSLYNEYTKAPQEIEATVEVLPNENYNILFMTEPTGDAGNKFSYKIISDTSGETVSLGRLIMLEDSESVQDYNTATNKKYYEQ